MNAGMRMQGSAISTLQPGARAPCVSRLGAARALESNCAAGGFDFPAKACAHMHGGAASAQRKRKLRTVTATDQPAADGAKTSMMYMMMDRDGS